MTQKLSEWEKLDLIAERSQEGVRHIILGSKQLNFYKTNPKPKTESRFDKYFPNPFGPIAISVKESELESEFKVVFKNGEILDLDKEGALA